MCIYTFLAAFPESDSMSTPPKLHKTNGGAYSCPMDGKERGPDPATSAEIAATCTHFRVKRAARLIGGIYDEALRPTGLKGTQFNQLVALSLADAPTIGQLADILRLDRTSLTRGLGPLERDGLVESVAGTDARERRLRLTAKGQDRLREASALWSGAQRRIDDALGSAGSAALRTSLDAFERALSDG